MMEVHDAGKSEEDTGRSISPKRKNIWTEPGSVAPSASGVSSPLTRQSPGSPLYDPTGRAAAGSTAAGGLTRLYVLESLPNITRTFPKIAIPLTRHEALLVHHYTEHLGRWLDCTDATRQFTLGVPEKVKLQSVPKVWPPDPYPHQNF